MCFSSDHCLSEGAGEMDNVMVASLIFYNYAPDCILGSHPLRALWSPLIRLDAEEVAIFRCDPLVRAVHSEVVPVHF